MNERGRGPWDHRRTASAVLLWSYIQPPVARDIPLSGGIRSPLRPDRRFPVVASLLPPTAAPDGALATLGPARRQRPGIHWGKNPPNPLGRFAPNPHGGGFAASLGPLILAVPPHSGQGNDPLRARMVKYWLSGRNQPPCVPGWSGSLWINPLCRFAPGHRGGDRQMTGVQESAVICVIFGYLPGEFSVSRPFGGQVSTKSTFGAGIVDTCHGESGGWACPEGVHRWTRSDFRGCTWYTWCGSEGLLGRGWWTWYRHSKWTWSTEGIGGK